MEMYAAVRIHEFGKEDRETVLLIPALSAYDFEDDSAFTGVEPIVS